MSGICVALCVEIVFILVFTQKENNKVLRNIFGMPEIPRQTLNAKLGRKTVGYFGQLYLTPLFY